MSSVRKVRIRFKSIPLWPDLDPADTIYLTVMLCTWGSFLLGFWAGRL